MHTAAKEELQVSQFESASGSSLLQSQLEFLNQLSSPAATSLTALRADNDIVNLKRTFPCRICRLPLSSASNRARHERVKHKEDRAAASASTPSKRSSTTAFEMEPEQRTENVNDLDLMEDQCDNDSESASQLEDSDSEEPDRPRGEPQVSSEPELDESEEPVATTAAAAESEQDLVFDSTLQSDSASCIDIDMSLSSVKGLRPLLKEEDLQACCYPFMVWLSQPPITQCEALVKARRVKTIGQLQPIKSNLRFIFALLYEREVVNEVKLHQLKQLKLCQALFEAMTSREVGSGRIHAVFLLVKKVLVFLSSQESAARRQFVQPTTYESFFFVDNICYDSSHQRKQESRNRALLGVKTSQILHKTQPMPSHQPFVVPTEWNAGPTVATAAANVNLNSNFKTTIALATSVAANHLQVPSNELSKEELQQIAKGCISYFHGYLTQSATTFESSTSSPQSQVSPVLQLQSDRIFMAHLVTATLCLGLAPRSQVLKQLRIGSSFVKQTDGRYWIRILAEMSKNGKPTMFAISTQLTAAFDLYFELIRPRLLAQLPRQKQRVIDATVTAAAATESQTVLVQTAQDHDYVFVKRNGTAPRVDFSSCTCLVTHRLIGRPINAHAFRAAVVTAFYETGASQSEMDVLATIMAHDPTTAKNFYFRPQIAAAAVQTNDKMAELLLQHV